jgi:UDP-3-O-[3-hydroxymyristoyl] glucosamine N-acyltransferase
VLIGSPAMPHAHGRRVHVLFTKLPEMMERLRELERKLDKLSEKG